MTCLSSRAVGVLLLLMAGHGASFPGRPARFSAPPLSADEPWDFGLRTAEGLVRLRLRPQAPNAAEYVRSLLRLPDQRRSPASDGPLEPDPQRPTRSGLRFYRAEPVPAHWGSTAWPDNYFGGRWGPPYALLQGSLQPTGSAIKPGSPDSGAGARPVIARGMCAWAAGGGGPEFFIALAEHPEWGNGHTVFAEVLPSDMALIEGSTLTRARARTRTRTRWATRSSTTSTPTTRTTPSRTPTCRVTTGSRTSRTRRAGCSTHSTSPRSRTSWRRATGSMRDSRPSARRGAPRPDAAARSLSAPQPEARP